MKRITQRTVKTKSEIIQDYNFLLDAYEKLEQETKMDPQSYVKNEVYNEMKENYKVALGQIKELSRSKDLSLVLLAALQIAVKGAIK